jgi:hypothetical protein
MAWSDCIETTKPPTYQDCRECGRETRTPICNEPNATWTEPAWGTCKGYYVMRILCCDGNNYTVTCKTGGDWNYMYTCGMNGSDTYCENHFLKTDPINEK